MSQGVKQNALDLAAYKKYKANKPTNLVSPMTYTNATTEGTYTGNSMKSPRADADKHFEHASLNLSAQIVRAI